MPAPIGSEPQYVRVPGPAQGLFDGLDPALPNEQYSPLGASTLDNFRVSRGTLKTRVGSSAWRTIGGSGKIQFLGTVYDTDSSRFRLAARGGVLYDWDEGDGGGSADASFQAVSGGGSLHASNRLQGVQLGDYWYFTDRSGSLRKYLIDPSSAVSTVEQPAAPASAPAVKARHYALLDTWDNIAGEWTQSAAGSFELTAASSAFPSPPIIDEVRTTARIKGFSGAGVGSPPNSIYYTTPPGTTYQTQQVGFWVKTDPGKGNFADIQVGLGSPSEPIRTPTADTWYPFFVNLPGNVTINLLKFNHNRALSNNQFYYVGPICIPGSLQGFYKWRYSWYNSTALTESELSPASDLLDLTAIGVSYRPDTAPAFKKSGQLTFSATPPAGATHMKIYRNGGIPELTLDAAGREIYAYVATVLIFSTTTSGSISAAGTSVTLTSVTGLAVGNWLQVDSAGTYPEIKQIASIVGSTVTFNEAFSYAHSSGVTVKMAYVDNTSNATIDATGIMALERDNPPSGIQWLDKYDGRLIAFRYASTPMGIAYSNRATPTRPYDYEVFPDDVDPLTRRDLLQGWRFNLTGAAAGDQIMWGGIFQGRPTVITQTGIWQIFAASQIDYGPTSVVQVLNGIGCINGDTVQIVNGALYWVAEGPRIMRWDGQGFPLALSTLRVNERLEAAPKALWTKWWAESHAKQDGHYYSLYYVNTLVKTYTDLVVNGSNTNLSSAARPFVAGDVGRIVTVTAGTNFTVGDYYIVSVASGIATLDRAVGTVSASGGSAYLHSGPSTRLDLVTESGIFEQTTIYETSGAGKSFWYGHVVDRGLDLRALYQVASSGAILQVDDPSVTADSSAAIAVSYTSKRYDLGGVVSRVNHVYMRLLGVSSDTVSLTVKTGGSEYGETSHSYSVSLAEASGADLEIRVPCHFDLKGRWVELSLSGSVSNAPEIREFVIEHYPIRVGYIKE